MQCSVWQGAVMILTIRWYIYTTRVSLVSLKTSIVWFYNSSYLYCFILADKPDYIQITSLTLKPKNGSGVFLNCTSTGIPRPAYRIYKITGPSSTLVANGKYHLIDQINYADYTEYKATFRCESKNFLGNFTKDIQLDIQGKIFQSL